MAFGKFIKKIFSFGKKEVEEVPAEEQAALEAPVPEPTPEVEAPTPEPAPEPEPEPEPEIEEPAPVIEPEPETVEPVAEVEEQAPEPEPKPAKKKKPAPKPKAKKAPKPKTEKPAAEPKPIEEVKPEAQTSEREEAAAEIEISDDGVFQPTPETAPEGIDTDDTPGPLSDKPEPSPTAEVEAEAQVSEPAPEPIRDESRGSVTIGDEDKVEAAPEPAPEPEKKSWLKRLTSGLSRSSKQLTENITSIFTKRKLDEDTLQDLEDVLIQADLGIETAMRITDSLSAGRYGKDVSTDEVRQVMGEEISKVLDPVAIPLELDLSYKPHVILVVGVNGTGKTTTIGKLAAKLRSAGLKVTLGAGDTFRAAAIEQLKIWADRTGSEFVATKLGADAAGLAYGAYETARDNGSDVVIIDTAGRLQNKTELMDELAKIVRVLQKHDPDAPHTVLQTLDATTGQNALSQVEIFRNIAGVNGLVMTKLDGTARGGILVAIAAKFKLPVFFIGVGEQVDDLEPFRADDFAKAIVGNASVEEETGA